MTFGSASRTSDQNVRHRSGAIVVAPTGMLLPRSLLAGVDVVTMIRTR
jgi:hypothetical protein